MTTTHDPIEVARAAQIIEACIRRRDELGAKRAPVVDAAEIVLDAWRGHQADELVDPCPPYGIPRPGWFARRSPVVHVAAVMLIGAAVLVVLGWWWLG